MEIYIFFWYILFLGLKKTTVFARAYAYHAAYFMHIISTSVVKNL